MVDVHLEIGATVACAKGVIEDILINLRNQGYETIGPMVKDGAVIYGPLSSMQDLPKGFTSEQDAGHYRLIYTGEDEYFSLTPGPHTWKQFFFPPRSELSVLRREAEHAAALGGTAEIGTPASICFDRCTPL